MRSLFALALLAGSSLVPAAALAQTAPAAPSTDDGATAGDALGDVVVTARRREENLQDVPIAVTAFTPTALQEKGVTDRTSLADNTPSLFTINGGYPREFAFFALRGQGPAFGSAPGVVNYFAEVPNTVNFDGRVGTYYDLANVQVLSGPQGTLFGKNATGGNILFEPAKPVNRVEGYIRGEYGNYNDRRIEGALNVPFVDDKVLFRVAGELGRRDGYTKDVGPNFRGKDYDNLSYESVRAALTLRPVDGVELYTVGRYYHSDNNGGGTVVGAINPAAGFDGTALGLGFIPLTAIFPGAATAVAEQQARGPRRVSYDLDQRSRSEYWQIINHATVDLSDELKLRNIISYSELQTKYGYDYDATPYPIGGQLSRNIPTIAPTFFTEELQLQGTAFDRSLTFSVGGYLERDGYKEPAGIEEIVNFPFGSLVPSPSATLAQRAKSEAIFGQATLDLGKVSPSLTGLSLTGGLRYTWEEVSVEQTIIAPPTISGTVNSKYLSYTATLDYDLSRGVHAYITARNAFKSGGVNGPVPVGSAFRTFPPEGLEDIEVGLKSQFLVGGVEVRANLAAYRGIYSDIQRTTLEVIGGVPLNVTRSAAEGKIQGFEFNGAIVPVRGLTLNGSYSYIDAKYTKVTDASAGAILAGAPFPYTPEHKLSVGGTYQRQIGDAGEFFINGNYSYQSRVSTAQTNSSFYNFLPSYGLLNANIGLRDVAGRPLDISLFATNITKTAKPVGVLDQYYAAGFVGLTYNEPRMYGVRVGYRFGK